MARFARFKMTDRDAWYHIHNRIAGCRGEYPLSEAVPTRKLIEIIEHFSRIYFCQVAAFSVMGNHFRLVAKFESPRSVDQRQLRSRAGIMYPSKASQVQIEGWTGDKWQRFHDRLFDVSEFMRNVQSAFARWYNRTYHRRGRFWADRFKSVFLENNKAVLDCMLYVELNPVRAGLVERPEEWRGSSIFVREIGKAGWLASLGDFCDQTVEPKALIEFRERLYYRGNVPTKPGQVAISNEVLDAEIKRGFATRGVFRKRLGYFVDGVAIGTEQFIRAQIAKMREEGQYSRRKNPIPQLDGIHLSLREQRSTSIVF
jgi:putative transposase